jgi:hypothetical protein
MCLTDLDLELEIAEIAEIAETGEEEPAAAPQDAGPQPAGGQVPGVAWG